MAKLSTREELALHEFSVRYRSGYYDRHPFAQTSFYTVAGAVRDQYEQEMEAKNSPAVEPPGPEPERGPEQPEP